MKEKQNAILLFSAGRDSFLSACYLMEKGYKVNLLTFKNGADQGIENVEHTVKRLKETYGEAINFIGIYPTSGIWREFFLPYLNMKPSEIIAEYGEITPSQFNCLTCRSAMYTAAIIKAKQMKIKIIADGARKDQGFVIELPIMIDVFQNFFQEYGIELKLPVYDLNSDWSRKNLLMMRGFIPKTLEPQCLMGSPLPAGKIPDEQTQQGVKNFFKKVVLSRSKSIIDTQKNLNIGEICYEN